MLNVPMPVPLPGRIHPVPFFAVGDDSFPLRSNIMQPYPLRNLSSDQRIYNYRLSRARRVVENLILSIIMRKNILRTKVAPWRLSMELVAQSVLVTTMNQPLCRLLASLFMTCCSILSVQSFSVFLKHLHKIRPTFATYER